MNTYGDAEPEDAWHPADDPLVLLDNLERRCRLLDRPTPLDRLAAIAERLDAIYTRDLDTRSLHRAELISEDLEYLRGRVDG